MRTAALAELTDPQFDTLRTIVQSRNGVVLAPGSRAEVASRLGDRLTTLGIEDFEHYLSFLTTGPFQNDETDRLLERVALPRTELFHDAAALHGFERRALGSLLEARRPARRVRLWAPACGDGAEAYALAALVHRALGVRLGDWRVEVLGTDVSAMAIEHATRGRYTAPAGVPEALLRRYFTDDGDGAVRANETLRSMVAFDTHDVRDGLGARRFGAWDAIACRGLLARLGDPDRTHALRALHDSLTDDGWLLTDSKDTDATHTGLFRRDDAATPGLLRKDTSR